MSRILGIIVAIVLLAGFLLFGGLLFPNAGKENHGVTREVELFSSAPVEEAKKKEDEPKPQEQTQELQEEKEKAPDPTEIVKNFQAQSELTRGPALEAASLSAIEAALSGQGGGGDFAEALSFTSGGHIGGLGKVGGMQEQQLDQAFSMAEIDQKPRVVYQAAPVYPAEMRGKNVEGVVTVIFIVDATGRVEKEKVEKSTHPAFEKPALDAIRRWKFEPAVKGGDKVSCKMRVSIRFERS